MARRKLKKKSKKLPPLKIFVRPDLPQEHMSAEEYRKRRPHHKRSKYNNVTTVIDGIEFMSKREALYYAELKLFERAKKIRDLQLQPEYPIYVKGDKLVCKVIADFSFTEENRMVAVDVKGVWTAVSRLKWKLAQACYPQIEWRIVR